MKAKKDKNPSQAEFTHLFNKLGWRAADVADRLGVNPSAISMILSGKRNPRQGTLFAMRNLVHGAKDDRSASLSDSQKRLYRKLKLLGDHAPLEFKSVGVVIEAVYEHAMRKFRKAEVSEQVGNHLSS